MIDNLLLYFNFFPSLMKFAKQRIIDTKKWFITLFVAQLILIAIVVISLSIMEIEEIVKARWLYRMITFISFSTIMATVYKSYREYSRDYLVTKSFQLTPLVTTIANILVGNIILMVLTLIIAIFKPINFETSMLAYLFFVLMTIISMILITVTLGLLDILSKKIITAFIVGSIVSFLLLPILYLPSTKTNLLNQVLKLNPFYYIVDGSATSAIFGAINIYNVTYHIYFLIFLVILGTLNFMIMRYVAHKKYRYSQDAITTKNEN
ncbi:teichoic acid transporter [Staphylococcus devriesei]|uniref:Teichoic acid transporter n=4 Tax=Staphylococcus devriesei TaxID=586733 RepID=A0ABX5I0Z3_9STAP|nr:teichoic acid transporter [Staphylococcus devriesei]MCE5090934.1 teichoic acid transporter [Staphylococcus devriesei]MCE5098041.1 teichoic acid transporter [Staphylococcus devriesei]PNZ87941.1 teichoic acid transporter [Staphylococcus devriesei]PTF13824.1 teichoic acid transporter [Staphylococcus devriesei]WKU13816.1 teichoic acid transporter [Staphylococcus devriesei]